MRHKKHTKTYFHLHLVSDSTGETINAVSRAVIGQFDQVIPLEHVYALVRSDRQLDRVIRSISEAPGMVLYTLMNDSLRNRLEGFCRSHDYPHHSVLDGAINMFTEYLGTEQTHKMGAHHKLNEDYFDRIEALTFTMNHDDGLNLEGLQDADIVLLGVSRTSKTPTSIYLANKGIKCANIPIVNGVPEPEIIYNLKHPMLVGLTSNPDRLSSIRRNRLRELHADEQVSDYAEGEHIRQELAHARRIFDRIECPVIDVSRRSIEETSAAILNLYHTRIGDK
ncbi:MAG: kinase/pyrophosphorylase [Alphaproteobacteria bacterium]|nr:kinase/pyrophosphorylase [Alphaproteobacteria bacterium]